MSRTIRDTRKKWHEVWPDSPGVGKRVKRTLHKAERVAAREEIAYELGEIPYVHARGVDTARSECGNRTH